MYVVPDFFYRQDFIRLNIYDHCCSNATELCLNKIPILKLLLCLSIWIFHKRGGAYYFLDIQSVFLFISSKRIGIFFLNSIFKIWSICARANCNYSLLRIIYIFLDMIWIWNLHWGYILINEAAQWFYQLDHVTFTKNVFWSVNCTVCFYQIYYIQM